MTSLYEEPIPQSKTTHEQAQLRNKRFTRTVHHPPRFLNQDDLVDPSLGVVFSVPARQEDWTKLRPWLSGSTKIKHLPKDIINTLQNLATARRASQTHYLASVEPIVTIDSLQRFAKFLSSRSIENHMQVVSPDPVYSGLKGIWTSDVQVGYLQTEHPSHEMGLKDIAHCSSLGEGRSRVTCGRCTNAHGQGVIMRSSLPRSGSGSLLVCLFWPGRTALVEPNLTLRNPPKLRPDGSRLPRSVHSQVDMRSAVHGKYRGLYHSVTCLRSQTVTLASASQVLPVLSIRRMEYFPSPLTLRGLEPPLPAEEQRVHHIATLRGGDSVFGFRLSNVGQGQPTEHHHVCFIIDVPSSTVDHILQACSSLLRELSDQVTRVTVVARCSPRGDCEVFENITNEFLQPSQFRKALRNTQGRWDVACAVERVINLHMSRCSKVSLENALQTSSQWRTEKILRMQRQATLDAACHALSTCGTLHERIQNYVISSIDSALSAIKLAESSQERYPTTNSSQPLQSGLHFVAFQCLSHLGDTNMNEKRDLWALNKAREKLSLIGTNCSFSIIVGNQESGKEISLKSQMAQLRPLLQLRWALQTYEYHRRKPWLDVAFGDSKALNQRLAQVAKDLKDYLGTSLLSLGPKDKDLWADGKAGFMSSIAAPPSNLYRAQRLGSGSEQVILIRQPKGRKLPSRIIVDNSHIVYLSKQDVKRDLNQVGLSFDLAFIELLLKAVQQKAMSLVTASMALAPNAVNGLSLVNEVVKQIRNHQERLMKQADVQLEDVASQLLRTSKIPCRSKDTENIIEELRKEPLIHSQVLRSRLDLANTLRRINSLVHDLSVVFTSTRNLLNAKRAGRSSRLAERPCAWIAKVESMHFGAKALLRVAKSRGASAPLGLLGDGSEEALLRDLVDQVSAAPAREGPSGFSVDSRQNRAIAASLAGAAHGESLGLRSLADALLLFGFRGFPLKVLRSSSAVVNPWNLGILHVDCSRKVHSSAAISSLGSQEDLDILPVAECGHEPFRVWQSQLYRSLLAVTFTRHPVLSVPDQLPALHMIALVQLGEQAIKLAAGSQVDQLRCTCAAFVEVFGSVRQIVQRRCEGPSGRWRPLVDALFARDFPDKFTEASGVHSVCQLLGVLVSLDATRALLADPDRFPRLALALLAEGTSRACRIAVNKSEALAREELRRTLGIAPDEADFDSPDPALATQFDIKAGKRRSCKFFARKWGNCSPFGIVGVLGLARALIGAPGGGAVQHLVDQLLGGQVSMRAFISECVPGRRPMLVQVALYAQGLRFHTSQSRRNVAAALLDQLVEPKEALGALAREERVALQREKIAKLRTESSAAAKALAARLRAREAEASALVFLQVHAGMPEISGDGAGSQHELVHGLPKHRCAYKACPLYMVDLSTNKDKVLGTRYGLMKHLGPFLWPARYHVRGMHRHGLSLARLPEDRFVSCMVQYMQDLKPKVKYTQDAMEGHSRVLYKQIQNMHT